MSSTSALGPAVDATFLRTAWAAAGAFAALPFLLLLPIDYDRLAPLALLPALWIGRRLWTSSSELSRSDKTDAFLLAVGFSVAIISSVAGQNPSASIVSLASTVWIFAGALLARQLTVSSRATCVVFIGITAGASLGCLAIWATWMERSSAAVFPFYGHWRVFGLHMMVGTLTGLVLLVRSQRPKLQILFIGLITTINCGGLLWSGGRAPLLGVAAALALWFWRSSSKTRRRLIRRTPWIIGGGLALSFLQWTPESYLGWWSAAARTAAATTVNELSSTRLDFWGATWQEFLQTPWIGRGADSYRYLVPKLDGDQPHNWILQFLLDFGIVGGGALAVVLVRQAAQGFARREANAEAGVLQIGAAAGFTACLITGLLDGVFYHAVVLIPAGFLAGIAGGTRVAHSAVVPSDPQRPTLNSKPSTFITLLPTKLHFGWSALVLSGAVLTVHSYLVLHLRYLPPPPSPDTLPARVLRIFPSTTAGVDAWLTHWRPQDDVTVLDWTLWAQQHSQAPARLHVYAAVIYADRDDFVAADREMELAEKTVHWTALENVRHMRTSIRKAGSNATTAPSD